MLELKKYAEHQVKDLSLVLEFIPLAFSALLPVINPIGSAVLFLGVVPNADHPTMKVMARKIAINTIWFLLIVQVTGSLHSSFLWRFHCLSCKSRAA